MLAFIVTSFIDALLITLTRLFVIKECGITLTDLTNVYSPILLVLGQKSGQFYYI